MQVNASGGSSHLERNNSFSEVYPRYGKCEPAQLLCVKIVVLFITVLGTTVNIVGTIAYNKLRSDADSAFRVSTTRQKV